MSVACDPLRNRGTKSLCTHLHCVVPGGGLSPDGSRWIACRPGFFLPVAVLSRLFRRLFLEGLQADLHMNRNGIATPIPISIVAPATAAPRQTSAMTVSDWNLVWLLGTALPQAFPMQLFILYSLSGGTRIRSEKNERVLMRFQVP
jgi:hypothetical protein